LLIGARATRRGETLETTRKEYRMASARERELFAELRDVEVPPGLMGAIAKRAGGLTHLCAMPGDELVSVVIETMVELEADRRMLLALTIVTRFIALCETLKEAAVGPEALIGSRLDFSDQQRGEHAYFDRSSFERRVFADCQPLGRA
jgi:hypothetical protein